MFKTKKLSAISIASLMLLSTLFSCSFTDREKADFVREEKIHELNKMKDLIIDNVKDPTSINNVFSKFESKISESNIIKEMTSLYDSCLKEVYSLIPVKEEFVFKGLDYGENKKLFHSVDEFILRNNLAGIPISSTRTLNLNSTTYEQWEEFFGENGTKCQTAKENYWDVKPFLSNKHFLKGLTLCLDKELFKDETSGEKYRIDYTKSDYFNYDLDLSRKYFSIALDELKEYYKNDSSRPIKLKMEIAFGSLFENDIALFEKLKNSIETAFNDKKVTKGDYNLEVVSWCGEYFSSVFPEKSYCGQFDLSYPKISSSSFIPYEFYKMLSTDLGISGHLTVNWNFDTSDVEKDSIVYDGYRYSYDTIVSALN